MNIRDLDPNEIEEVGPPKLNINQLNPEEVEEVKGPSMMESAIQGAKESASFGFLDELGGAMEAAGSAVGIRGLGEDELQFRRETPEEAKMGIADVYKYVRDKRRAKAQEAQEANPGSYMAGGLVGGLATAGPGGALAKGLGGGLKGAVGAGIAEGAAQGLGSSEAENIEGLAKDTALGAGLGGGISGGMGALGKIANKVPDFIPAAREGNTIGNKAAATMSPRRLLPGTTKQDLLDYFSNPELRKKASTTDVSNEVSKLSSKLGDEMDASKKAVQGIYGELEDKAVKEITDTSSDILGSATQTIKDNPKDMFSARVRSAIKTAKKIAEGKAGLTKDKSDGERLLLARRFLDKGVGDRKTLSQLDNELIDEARDELQSVLRQSEPMRQADELYTKFKGVRKGLEDKVFSGPKGAKELDPEKLRRAMTTTTLKGEAFEEALQTYDNFVQSNPRLAAAPEVQTAKASLEKLKEVIDVGQLEYKLSKSGGPTAEAAFLVAQGIGSSAFGPMAFIGLPLVNPTVWSAIVDNVSPNARALMKNIEKAAPVIRSAAIRETVRQKNNQPE